MLALSLIFGGTVRGMYVTISYTSQRITHVLKGIIINLRRFNNKFNKIGILFRLL